MKLGDDHLMRAVVEIFDRDGIEAVVEQMDVTERTARRWLGSGPSDRGMR